MPGAVREDSTCKPDELTSLRGGFAIEECGAYPDPAFHVDVSCGMIDHEIKTRIMCECYMKHENLAVKRKKYSKPSC